MRQPVKSLFVSHGGGPMPLLRDSGQAELVNCLKQIASEINKPDAIVLVSAHFEANRPTLTAGKNPSLIYDYSGFSSDSYEIKYPCPGAPSLAHEIEGLLSASHIDSTLDATRGFDHGLFVPLKIMYPEATIPCVQLSLVNTLDPERHIRIGQSLNTLNQNNILVIGSGSSFHNTAAFFSDNDPTASYSNRVFEH